MISRNTENKTSVLLVLETVQSSDGDASDGRFEYSAVMYEKPDALYLVYDDKDERCSLKITHERVLMCRHGSGSRLLLEKGARCRCSYATPCGVLDMETRTSLIDNSISENGRLKVVYTLKTGEYTSENTVTIKIKEI